MDDLKIDDSTYSLACQQNVSNGYGCEVSRVTLDNSNYKVFC